MTDRSTPVVPAPQQSQAARIVEVFYPSNAPHLAPVACKIQTAVEEDIDKVLGDSARAMGFFVSVAAAARAIAAFAKFRAALGEQIGSDGDG